MKLKYFFNISLIIGLALGMSSCYKAPEFSNTPTISFNKSNIKDQVQYYDIIDGGDSLVVNFLIQDGDGDIGLGSDDIDPPYNPLFYFDSVTVGLKHPNFSPSLPLIKYGYLDNGIGIRTTLNDTLPNYEEPYITQNYTLFEINEIEYIYYIQNNPDNKNIFVKFYSKNSPNDEFVLDQLTQGIFNARIPVLPNNNISLESELSYSMVTFSLPFKSLYKNKIIKIEIMIQDRALRKSNVIATEPFTLVEVQVN